MNFPDKIDAERLVRLQREVGSRLSVFFREITESTNSDAVSLIASGAAKEDFVCISNIQTAGRGRVAGRRWESTPGNIFLSCGFLPQGLRPERLANLTLWFGVALAKMLREKFDIPVAVKWPNDIWCSGKKMAGMLAEAHANSGSIRGIVFGVGLNVNTIPQGTESFATSLMRESGEKTLDVNRVCADVLLALENAYANFLAGTHGEKLSRIWKDFDLLDGQRITGIFADERIEGTACGIDSVGNLCIQTDSGVIRKFSAGDISLLK